MTFENDEFQIQVRAECARLIGLRVRVCTYDGVEQRGMLVSGRYTSAVSLLKDGVDTPVRYADIAEIVQI